MEQEKNDSTETDVTASNTTTTMCNGESTKDGEVESRAETDVEQVQQENIEAKELEELTSYVDELKAKFAHKDGIRHRNQNINYTESEKCSKLDSSVKRNTAFVRRIKTFTESQLQQLLKEMSTLNIEKYISEIASALIEAKLKLSDIPSVITLCSSVHESYPEFSKILFESWQKVLVIKKDEKIANPSKMRVDLRFYSDLVAYGVFPQKDALPLLGNVLTSLTAIDREEHNYSSILLSFCKHCGEDYAGLVPRRIRELAEKHKVDLPRSTILPAEKQKTVKLLLCDYYASLCNNLTKEHKDLRAYEKQNKKILQTKGELNNDRKEKLEAMQTSFQKLQTVVQNFAEILDEDVPVLQVEKERKLSDEIVLTEECADSGAGGSLWDDEETQRFYESMPDVKDFLPQNKKELEPVAEPEPAAEEMSDEKLDEEFNKDDGDDEKPVELDAGDDENSGSASLKNQLDTFLNHLPNCINKEMIDNAAVDFLMTYNNKSHRKRLVKTLFNIPRTRLDLLPLYSRLVAILHPVMPDVATDLVALLKADFRYHVRKKDQINIETKIKVIRFIGELVKFQMYPKYEGLHCLKVLLNDFTHHHIEMACNLLECAGRFFYRNAPDTRQRTRVYMEQMMRKKSALNLDSRYVTMIENAYYYVNPPETVSTPVMKLPPLHQFIRKILYQDLDPNDEKETRVLNLMRKLDWKEQETSDFAIKCLTHAWNVKYLNTRCLANLLAGLVEHQEFVGTRVVDGVLEDIRLGLELNMARMNQRRIAMVKYCGELYNYRMVESNDVFKCLYTLISFGVAPSHDVVSVLDPPANTFRLRLVCVLLETCGQYFNHGLSKTRLDYFFVYFQHYYWLKYSHPVWTTEKPFPVQIKYLVRDILSGLRPHMKLSKNLDEAKEGLNELQKKLLAKLEPVSNSGARKKESSQQQHQHQQLTTILEGESENVDDPEAAAKESAAERTSRKNNSDDNNNNRGDDGDDEDSNAEDEDDDDGEDEDGDDEYDEDEDEYSRTIVVDDEYQGFPAESVFDFADTMTPRERRLDPEDEAFADAFDRMVSDDVQDRMRETIKPQQIDISVPYNVRNSLKKNYEQLQQAAAEDAAVAAAAAAAAASAAAAATAPEVAIAPTAAVAEVPAAKASVNFVVLLRKGNKQQYKNLEIPLDSDLAKNLKSQERAERVEMEKVKRLTLDINERLEEEDYQEQIQTYSQKQLPSASNREKKKKFQHQKGAPDVDLILGKKKVLYK